MHRAAPYGRELEPIDQIIERALVDQTRRVALDHRLGDPERLGVEPLVQHAYARAVREQDFDGRASPTKEPPRSRKDGVRAAVTFFLLM